MNSEQFSQVEAIIDKFTQIIESVHKSQQYAFMQTDKLFKEFMGSQVEKIRTEIRNDFESMKKDQALRAQHVDHQLEMIRQNVVLARRIDYRAVGIVVTVLTGIALVATFLADLLGLMDSIKK